MLRPFIGLLGILTILFSDDMIEIFEGIAIENSDENTIKPWINSGIRAEGIVVTAASLIGGRAYVWMMISLEPSGLLYCYLHNYTASLLPLFYTKIRIALSGTISSLPESE